MSEDQLRDIIKRKLSNGSLLCDVSLARTAPVNIGARDPRGNICAICQTAIPPSEYLIPYRSHLDPHRIMVFHNHCEHLWREEAYSLTLAHKKVGAA